jgi:hypothetical protein
MLVEALCGRVEAITDDVDYPGRLGRSCDGPRRSAGVLRPERIAQ